VLFERFHFFPPVFPPGIADDFHRLHIAKRLRFSGTGHVSSTSRDVVAEKTVLNVSNWFPLHLPDCCSFFCLLFSRIFPRFVE